MATALAVGVGVATAAFLVGFMIKNKSRTILTKPCRVVLDW